jgi:enolase-phosphatase E1
MILPLGVQRAWLLDIEGTTTSVCFVHEILFPFAREHVEDFLHRNWMAPEVQRDVAGLRSEYAADMPKNAAPPAWHAGSTRAEQGSAAAYVRWLVGQDRKSTPLKSLQGKIWESGYRGGQLRADVYADVPRALRRWRERGERIAIFSSGSVLAQKLLFAHTTEGDLTSLLDAYFDTTTGPKVSAESYKGIAEALAERPETVVFVSDAVTELDAAARTGVQTVLCVREGDPPSRGTHPVIASFDELP